MAEREEVQLSVDEAVQVGIELHRHGRLDEAEGIYRRLLQARPDHPDLHHFLGVLLAQRGRHEAAEQSIRAALRLAPGYVDARNNLGNVLRQLRRDAEAEVEYRQVLEQQPGHAGAWNNLGNLLRLQRRLGDAIAAYERALQLDPDHAEASQNLGNAYRSAGRVDEAIACYRKSLALNGGRVALYVHLGRILFRHGRLDEAAAVYRQWLQREPEHPIALHMLAACTGQTAPDRASDAFVTATFDAFAEDFDEVLAELEYQAPRLCAGLVEEQLAGRSGLRVLDAGCGTGLCGALLRPFAARLDGVDLSPAMLSRARERGVYDKLERHELVDHLRRHRGAYDVVVAADVLVYFGELAPLLQAAAAALGRGGLLVFTVERAADPAAAYVLHPHGRYSHGRAATEKRLFEAGLQLAACREVQLRLEGGEPVSGLLFAARCR